MTISSENRKSGPYAGNGVTNTFPFTFKVFKKEDVLVTFTTAAGDDTALVLDSDYSIVLNLDQDASPGGTVTFPAVTSPLLPLATGQSLTLTGALAYTQPTDIPNLSSFFPTVVEDALDRAEIQIQQLAEEVSRSIKVSISDPPLIPLPSAPNRANSVFGFDAQGNIAMLGLPASIGAGDLRIEEWTDGVNYTAGTSTSVQLSRAYGVAANLGTVVMQGIAQDPASYTLSGTTLTFNAPIPIGVSKIWCIGGTTLSVSNAPGTFIQNLPGAVLRAAQDKMRDIVNVMDFGADPSGTNDSTAAFQNAANAARKVVIPAGVWLIGPVTVPSNTVIVGEGYATLINAKPGTTGTALFQTAANAQYVSIGDMRIDLSPATFQNTMGVYLNATVGAKIHDIVMLNCGLHGVGSNNDTDTTVENITLSNSFGGAIYMNTSTRLRISKCKIDDANGVNSGITVSGGSDITVEDSYIASISAGFGISYARVSRGKIWGNTTFNTKIEGINCEGCSDVDIYDNICTWSGSVSNDFGISVFGSTAQGSCTYIKVRGNKVYNCASSGIALAAQTNVQFCDVTDNTVINCNAKNLSIAAGGGAGVMLYGLGCQQNVVQNNDIIDTGVAHLLNGIQEVDSQGFGQAATNRFMNNRVYNAASATVFKQPSSVEALSRDNGAALLSWTPIIASSTGTLGATVTAAAQYYETEKRIDYYLRFSITSNGSGAGTLTFTMPYAVNFITGHGRENAVSGKALTVTGAAGNKGEVRFYDNSYPGANGAIIEVAGTFFRQ